MDKVFWEKILSQLANPSRVQIGQFEDGNYFIMSAQNLADTFDWFHLNAKKLQDYLNENGFSYIYIFELAKKRGTAIYMLVGKHLTEEYVQHFVDDFSNGSVNEFIIDNRDWNDFDADRYDESISDSYYNILRFCDSAFKILCP